MTEDRAARTWRGQGPCDAVGFFRVLGACERELRAVWRAAEPRADIEEHSDSADLGRTMKMKFGKCGKTEENPKGVDRTVLHVWVRGDE